jgi:hypothetical protein
MKFTTPMDHVRKNCSYGSLIDNLNNRCNSCTCNEEKELYKGEPSDDQHPFWEPQLLNPTDYAQTYRPWVGERK